MLPTLAELAGADTPGAVLGVWTTCTVPVLGNRSVTASFTKTTVRVTSAKAKVTKQSVLITSKVKVSGAGKITQRATTGKGKKMKTWCKASKKAGKAGTYTLKCNLGKKGRSALRKQALKLTLRTTFTPTGGTARSTVRTVVFASLKPRYTG